QAGNAAARGHLMHEHLSRSHVLVCGKSAIGTARRLNCPIKDSLHELIGNICTGNRVCPVGHSVPHLTGVGHAKSARTAKSAGGAAATATAGRAKLGKTVCGGQDYCQCTR